MCLFVLLHKLATVQVQMDGNIWPDYIGAATIDYFNS